MDKVSGVSLRRLLDETVRNIRALESLDLPTEHWDALLIYLISTKLHFVTLKEWENSCKKDGLSSFDELTHRAQVLE